MDIKSKLLERNGINYLSFTPEGMYFETIIPVIQKGKRSETNAWSWNGSLENPTLRPSVRTVYANKEGKNVMIHYWLNDGVCQCLPDCTDGNNGRHIKLKSIDSNKN